MSATLYKTDESRVVRNILLIIYTGQDRAPLNAMISAIILLFTYNYNTFTRATLEVNYYILYRIVL